MKQYMVNLAEVARFRAHSREPTFDDLSKSVILARDETDPGAVLVQHSDGQTVGILPRRGDLCKAILAGARVGHASWQGIGAHGEDGHPASLRVRVVLVEEGETFEMPPQAPARTYAIGIVGEASYQTAIRRCANGETVKILHEMKNPYDALALAVVTARGDIIGYIPRDSWLRRAIHEEGKGCDATIKEIASSNPDKSLGVVLDVTLNARGVGERSFNRPKTSLPPPERQEKQNPQRKSATRPKGWLARLLGL